MSTQQRVRIFLTGVGGQGTLTATTLLARVAVDQRVDVVAGEIHGMAQRGGVVESTVMLGGWKSPKIGLGEADILLGFELVETLRALPYLRPGGVVFASSDMLPPPGVALGRESAPDMAHVQERVAAVASQAWYVPVRQIGIELGAPQIGNAALLGALCASGLLPFGLDALVAGIQAHLPARQAEVNIQAAMRGQSAMQRR